MPRVHALPSAAIRLFASDYRQLRARLERDVRNAQAIIVQQTLDEQFLELLRAQVRPVIPLDGLSWARLSSARPPRAARAGSQVRANTEHTGQVLSPASGEGAAPGGEDDDHCMGCMQVRANIRLRRQCTGAARAEGAQQPCDGTACFCRPMWCLDWYDLLTLDEGTGVGSEYGLTGRDAAWLAALGAGSCRSRTCAGPRRG